MMMTKYHKWSVAALQQANIRAEDKAYLSETGVPVRDNWLFDFERSADVPSGYTLLGFGADTPICISPSGNVVVLDDGNEAFLNSTPTCFAKSLAAYFDYQSEVEKFGIDDEVAALELVERTENRLKEIDPNALANSDHVWPQMVEQMRDGSA